MKVVCSARVKIVLAPIDADKCGLPAYKDALKEAWKLLSLVTSASVSGPTTSSGDIAKIVPSARLTLNVKPENRAPGAELSDNVARRVYFLWLSFGSSENCSKTRLPSTILSNAGGCRYRRRWEIRSVRLRKRS